MKFYQKLDGAVHVSAREYDIDSRTEIIEGQVVKLVEGRVQGVTREDRDVPILGISAENHSGKDNALDPRANGKRIFVIDDPTVVMQCAAPEVTAVGGKPDRLDMKDMNGFDPLDFNGGYVKLMHKAEGSNNTDAVGRVRRILISLESRVTGCTVFMLEDGGTPCAGDIYAIFPPIGFSKGVIDKTRITFSSPFEWMPDMPLMVMGHDLGLSKINLIARRHIFAASGS